MWSYFEDLDVKNTIVQSEFNLNIHSAVYEFFYFKLVCMWVMSLFCLLYMHAYILFSVRVTIYWIGSGPSHMDLLLQAMEKSPVTLSDV